MKKILPILLMSFITYSVIMAAPRAKIVFAPVTPSMYKSAPFTQDSTVFNGIGTVPNHTYAYFYVWNWGDNTPITSATWNFNSKPAGSNATLSTFQYSSQYWAKFKADTTGVFQIHVTMTTSSGSIDTIANIVSQNFVGTGGFYGIAPQYPNCMTCHQGQQPWQGIFDRWKVGGHANRFRYEIDSGGTYSTACMPCHTTGYNKYLTVNNHGFENIAQQLGWVWANYNPPKAGNWDTLRADFPSLVAFASIGCENCHGPGSEHAASGDTNKIMIDLSPGNCAGCHDSPPHHIKTYEYNQSVHAISNTIYTSSWAQTPSSPDYGTNDLNNCIRCHDARGYVNFTYGRGTNTVGWSLAQTVVIGCPTCHDPHSNNNYAIIRNRPTNSDTLANGYHYAGGNGKVCLDCHKSRSNATTYVQTRVTSSHWGPHSGTQGDILLGQNAANFGTPYISGSHANITDACVQCHMAPTADTGTPSWSKVGEHTFKMTDSVNNYDNVNGCLGCHPGVTKFSDFMAPYDFAGIGHTADWQSEVAAAIENMARALPHTGLDSVSWSLIAADSNNVNLRKVYWNYQMLVNDRSKGLHNPFYVLSIYNASMGVIGIKPVSNEIPNKFELGQNFPNPFNPTTTIKFSIAKTSNVTVKIYDILGREVMTLVDAKLSPGKYDVKWSAVNNSGHMVASGVYFYRIETGDFTDVKKMVLVK